MASYGRRVKRKKKNRKVLFAVEIVILALLTVVLLAALGGAEVQLKSHAEGALEAGSTREEVVCALVHASGYMGIPRLFNALNVIRY